MNMLLQAPTISTPKVTFEIVDGYLTVTNNTNKRVCGKMRGYRKLFGEIGYVVAPSIQRKKLCKLL